MKVVEIDTKRVSDWASFHRLLAEGLNFPSYYGANGNAFIDCLTDITRGQAGGIVLAEGETLLIDLGELGDFRDRCPGMIEALADWTSAVNHMDWEEYDPPREPRVLVAYRGLLR